MDNTNKLKFLYEDYDQPDDSHLANSDISEFFALGREYANSTVNHKYTEQERLELLKYDSLDYLPPWSDAYKSWVKKQPNRLEWDRWIMMGMIGFTVGVIGFLLHQLIDIISDTKWSYASEFLQDGLGVSWIFSLGYGLIFLIPATALVVWYRPSAGGSGIPELIGFLNGTIIRHIFNIRTMVVKFISCVFAVGAGMPVGPEGPMIHLGGLIGAGLSQFKSDSLGIHPGYFQRFRNSEDKRNFISAGVAAGVSSAFGAPVGGLLFSMEEVSSFWNLKLSWQTFFCCMVATFTTELFNSAFTGFHYNGYFGFFDTENSIIFEVDSDLPSHILFFLPTIVLGVIGGVLGSVFTFLNVKISRLRRRFLSKFENEIHKNILRMAEPCIILIIYSSFSILLPNAFPCTENECHQNKISENSENCLTYRIEEKWPPRTESDVELYTCPVGTSWTDANVTINNKTYNQGTEGLCHNID